MSKTHVHFVVDAKGNYNAVQLSAALWALVEKHVLSAEKKLTGTTLDPFAAPEPLGEFAEFKACWDFRYPYEAHVICSACGAKTDNWEHDPDHPFHLTNANFGGLLVFRCKACGATVRKKHFRDHVAFEHTAANAT